ncbi:MAG TPA: SGNH/GDSL hydrolase family protein [Myxococcota bacterium]|nr:SGNH/GDSL hydrolase family protein [Myxococcota bacterium]
MTARRKRLLFSAIALLLFLGLIEAASWGLEILLWGAPYPDGQPRGMYTIELGRPTLNPGVELPGLLVDVRINSWGFRDDEVVEPKPERALRVWVVGGSTTFDIYSRDNASAWPNLVEQRLQAALPERSVEVLNAGIPGDALMGSIKELETWGERFDPDLVVLYHGPNDLRMQRVQEELQKGPPKLPPQPLLTRLALPRLLARGSRPQAWTQGGTFLPEQHLSMAEQGLRDAIRLTRQLGADPLLVTHPLRVVRASDGSLGHEMNELAQLLMLPPEESVKAFDAYNELVRGIAKRERIQLAEVAPAVDSSPENWGDLTHFRRPGSEICAQVVSEALLESPRMQPD